MFRFKLGSLFLSAALMTGLAAAPRTLGQEASKTVTLGRDSKVGGQTLTKGSYTIKFSEGKDGELSFLRGKQEVVKAAYKLAKLNARAQDTVVVFTAGDDGSFQIKRIELKGSENALVLQ